jgi:hypothetical protein
MTNGDPTSLTLDDWIADLDASDAEIEEGQVVPLAPVLDRLRASIARMEARQAGLSGQARKA